MKDYDQYCPIAHALGLVGERWTLLVVRELLDGPAALHRSRRRACPASARTSSPTRLKELEAAGIVEKKKLPPPGASTVYELTPAGRELRPVLHELARCGARSIGPPPPDALEPGWLVHALDLALSPLCRGGTIAFRVGDEEASLVDCAATRGIAEDYDVARRDRRDRLLPPRRGPTSSDGVRIEGDRRCSSGCSTGFAASRAASRLSTSHASATSSSVVRALPTASRST